MSNCSPGTSSARRLERRAKAIVCEDVKRMQSSGGPQFFIDEEVYLTHLPILKDTIDDSSISDFLLRYNLDIHMTELIQYFGPSSSTKRDFVNLKYMSHRYGCHLCYMALRESATHNNEIKDLIRQMESTAISLNKKPPSDLFASTFLPLPLITSSTLPPQITEDSYNTEDEPMGQEEVQINSLEQTLADMKLKGDSEPLTLPEYQNDESQQSQNLTSKSSLRPTTSVITGLNPFTQSHLSSCGCSSCYRARNECSQSPEVSQQIPLDQEATDTVEQTDIDETIQSTRRDNKILKQFSAPHVGACNCLGCQKFKNTYSEAGVYVIQGDPGVGKTALLQLGNIEETRDIDPHRIFSALHLGSCTCHMCIKARERRLAIEPDLQTAVPDFIDIKRAQSMVVIPDISNSVQESGYEENWEVEYGVKSISNTTSHNYSSTDEYKEVFSITDRETSQSWQKDLPVVNEEEDGYNSHRSDNDDKYSSYRQETNDGQESSFFAHIPISLNSINSGNTDSGKPISNFSSIIITTPNVISKLD